MLSNSTPPEDRRYVLRFRKPSPHIINRFFQGEYTWEYYTGEEPTKRLGQAKQFKLSQAKGAKQFGHTTGSCDIIRITDKMLFLAALEGK